MSYSQLLKPRPEVLSEEGIEGIIDLANLSKKKKLEGNPKRFFDLTWPTADIRRVIQRLSDRFSKKGDTSGLFLFEGLKGSGKSHLLLFIYHLFESYEIGREWLEKQKIECQIPRDATVIVNKFTDLPLYSIWDFIYERFTGNRPEKRVVQPDLEEIKDIIQDRKLILILDELEQGIRVIGDEAIRNQNIAFLQMLSEWSNREDQVTIFASIYSDKEEPGSTLLRVNPCRIQFAHSPDRAKVVLHRLFENYLDFDVNSCSSTIDSYLNVWRRHSLPSTDEYRSRMLLTYPFLPEMMELILERVPAKGGFQSVRGALGFLANIVRLTHTEVDLITAAHADLRDREVAIRLSDLDASGDLIPKARGNLDDLKDQTLAAEIASTVMLHTLTGSGRDRGASREELLRHVLNPRININDFEKTLLAFQKYAAHFHFQEGKYLFDLEENPDAKVEFRSLTIDSDGSKAKGFLRSLWRDEVFREPSTVIYEGEGETKEALNEIDKNRLRFVLAPRRLSQSERHALFHGLPMRNQVVLLEPRDPTFNLDTHRDLLKWAKRQLAARDLAETAREAERRNDYERIEREDRSHCVDVIKRAGLILIKWEKYGERPQEDEVEEESIAGQNREAVFTFLSQQLFPLQLFEEHLASRRTEITNRPVRGIDEQYRSTLGFPVPTTPRSVSQALRELCRKGEIGIRHPRGNFCGENPGLNETELFEATVSEPFEVPAGPTVTTDGEKVGIGGIPSGTDEEGGTGGGTSTTETTEKIEISIPPQESGGALRQAVAVRLQEFPDSEVAQIRATIFLEKETGDLSTLPSAIRGSLSGPGAITAEITVTKNGEFTKEDVESIIESLPSLPGAYYGARLEVLLSLSEEEPEEGVHDG